MGGLAPNATWSRRIGGLDHELLYDMAVAADGSVVLAGSFKGTVDFGGTTLSSAGEYDIFLVRYGADGTLLDARRYGDVGDDDYVAVAVDGAGNALLGGRCAEGSIDLGDGAVSCGNGASFLAKLEPDGDVIWKRGPSPFTGTMASLAVAPGGDIVELGGCAIGCDFGGGPLPGFSDWDVYLARFDASGAHLWSKRFADTNQVQNPVRVAIGPTGSVHIVGYFGLTGLGNTIDFGGGPFTMQGPSFFDYDAFVATFDAAGNHLWSKALGNAQVSLATGLSVAANGDLLVAGGFEGAMDFGAGAIDPAGNALAAYVVRYDAAGNHVWTHTSAGGGARARDVAVAPTGVVQLGGNFSSTVDLGGGPLLSAGSGDAFLVALDAAGQHLASRRFGDGCPQAIERVAVAPGGGTVVAGWLDDAGTTIDLGNGPLVGAGGRDVFVALLPP
jgi:hypothetical protein